VTEDLEVIRAIYREWNELGLDHIAARFWARDIEWHDAPEAPGPAVYRGRDEVVRMSHELMDALGEIPMHLEELIDCGDEVVARIRPELVGSASGAAVTGDVYHVFCIRDGRVARLRQFFSRAEAFAAAGRPTQA
jgi:ketosteroid isomerase-like protein